MQICPLVDKTVAGLNPKLKTLNGKAYVFFITFSLCVTEGWWASLCLIAVLAKVDKYAEIEYSMVSSPAISQATLDLNMKVKKTGNLKHVYLDDFIRI